jgi:hypothetical protein
MRNGVFRPIFPISLLFKALFSPVRYLAEEKTLQIHTGKRTSNPLMQHLMAFLQVLVEKKYNF